MINLPTDRSQLDRKGIFQTFSGDGNVIADERWRIRPILDRGVRLDTDTVRIAPFIESRSESVAIELNAHLRPRRVSIHALAGRRESRIDLAPPYADVCWRLDDASKTRQFGWAEDCEIGYNSPLFSTVTLWNLHEDQNVPGRRQVLCLDAVTFEPSLAILLYTNLGTEEHETRFGLMKLTHFRIDNHAHTADTSHFWCDHMGVIFDFVTSSGSGYKLVAVNFAV